MSAAIEGVWVTHAWDNGPYAIAIYATAEEATKHTGGYASIAWWPVGMELRDAIEAWR